MSTSARHDVDEGEAATPAEPGLRDTDPVGAQIYWYPARPPTGTWAYIVDDTGLRYRRQGWWPFRRGNAADERRQIGAARASAARRGCPSSTATCAAGRLSVSHRTPNTARPGRTT